MRGKLIDWKTIDPVILAGKLRPIQMCRMYGVSQSSMSRRRLTLSVRKEPYDTMRGPHPEKGVPFVPPQERMEKALKVKARTLGQPIEWVRQVWMKGEAGRQFQREYGR